MTCIDTPGLDDPNGRDTEIIERMVKTLKDNFKKASAIFIVINYSNKRLSRSLQVMIKTFENIFGEKFFDNVAILFTHY